MNLNLDDLEGKELRRIPIQLMGILRRELEEEGIDENFDDNELAEYVDSAINDFNNNSPLTQYIDKDFLEEGKVHDWIDIIIMRAKHYAYFMLGFGSIVDEEKEDYHTISKKLEQMFYNLVKDKE